MIAPALSLPRIAGLRAEEVSSLILQVWEAVNSEREIEDILRALVDTVEQVLHFTEVSIVSFELRGTQCHGTYCPAKISLREVSGATNVTSEASGFSRQLSVTPFDFNTLQRRLHSGKPFNCPDLLAKQRWQDYEFSLAQRGARTYVLLPLLFRERVIGAALFSRHLLEPFAADQLWIMRQLAPAIATAVANSFENQKSNERTAKIDAEVRSLRSRLASYMNSQAAEASVGEPWHNGMACMRDRMVDWEVESLPGAHSSMKISGRLDEEERRLIETALAATRGRISGANGAALRLGLPASTLEFRIKRLGIDKFRYRSKASERR